MNISPDINVFTCTIGKKASQAKYFLEDTFHVVNFLEQINEVQDKINNGLYMKKDTMKSKGKRHYSIANFNPNFNKLTEFT